MRSRRIFAAGLACLALWLSAIAALADGAQPKPAPKYIFWPMKRYPLVAYKGRINGIGTDAGKRYYFATTADLVYAIDYPALDALWQSEPKARDPNFSMAAKGAAVAWQFKASTRVSYPPVAAGGLAIVIDDQGNAAGLDEKGKTTWARAVGEPPAAAPMALGERVLVPCAGGNLAVLDAKTGKAMGDFKAGDDPIDYSCVFDGQLYAVLRGGDIAILGPDRKETGRLKGEKPYRGPLAVSKEAILAVQEGGFVEFYDRTKGKPRWSRRLGLPFRKVEFMGPKRVCLMGTNDALFCLSSRTGDLIWWRHEAFKGIPMPMFWQGRIAGSFLTSEIFGLLDRTGEPRWRFNVGTKIVGDLHPWGGNMAVHMYNEKADQGYLQLMGPVPLR